MKRLVLLAGLVGAFIFNASVAQAQATAGAAPSLSNSLSGPAKEAFESAHILLNNVDFAGALAKYDQAYALSSDPRLLFNMAICARGLRAYARMQSLLVRYQREAGAMISADEQDDIDAALSAIRNLVGAVRLNVAQVGAKVVVDGQEAGTTPLLGPLVLDLGEHALVVQKTGFEPYTKGLWIAGGNEVSLKVALVAERRVAELIVPADPQATVAIDGKVGSKGRFDERVAPGTHDVRVSQPGKVPYRAHIELRDGETRRLEVTLEPEADGRLPLWIGGAIAVAAGAVVGGYFLLKSSDSQSASAPFLTVHLASFKGQ